MFIETIGIFLSIGFVVGWIAGNLHSLWPKTQGSDEFVKENWRFLFMSMISYLLITRVVKVCADVYFDQYKEIPQYPFLWKPVNGSSL